MKLLLLCLLLTSCAHSSRVIKSERHDTVLVGLKCPVNYYYRLDDRLCHYQPKSISSEKSPVLAKNSRINGNGKAKVGKPVKQDKIDCGRVMNQCFKGDL